MSIETQKNICSYRKRTMIYICSFILKICIKEIEELRGLGCIVYRRRKERDDWRTEELEYEYDEREKGMSFACSKQWLVKRGYCK